MNSVAEPPPAFEYEAPTQEGTIKAHPNFTDDHAEQMVKDFQRAFRGIGTDENRIMRILTEHNNEQRQDIIDKYKTATGKDLIEDLKYELSGNFEDLCVALLEPTENYQAKCLRMAMADLGTNDDWLVEILVPRTAVEIKSIVAAYEKLYECNLEKDVCSETSGTFQRVLVSVLQGGRDQKEAGEVDQDQMRQDVEDLYNSGEGKFGTDEDVFNRVFALRSWAHMRAICEQYRIKAGRELEESIEREFVFNEKKAFLAIVKYAKDPAQYFADRINVALKDDNDDSLIRLIVAHCETDLVTIMERFKVKYGQRLEEVIKEECRGDFCKLLLRILDPQMSFK